MGCAHSAALLGVDPSPATIIPDSDGRLGEEVPCPRNPYQRVLLVLLRKGGRSVQKNARPGAGLNKLREAEMAIAAGSTVAKGSHSIGVTQQTLYRWRSE